MPSSRALLVIVVCFFLGWRAETATIAQPPITSVQFSPREERLVTGSQAGIEMHSWPELKQLGQLDGEFDRVLDLKFSPSGKLLAAAGGKPQQQGLIRLYDWPSGKLRRERIVSEDLICAVAWSGDGRRLAAAGYDGIIYQLANDLRSLQLYRGHSRSVLDIVWLNEPLGAGAPTPLVSVGADHSLRLWDLASGKAVRTMNNHTETIRAVALRPRSGPLAMVATASADRTVRLWQPTIGRLVRFARLPSEPLDVCWTPDGDRLIASCVDGRIRVIDASSVAILQDSKAISGWAYAVACSPSGDRVAVGGEQGQRASAFLLKK